MKKGFTLIELMIVIVVIGVLAAITMPRFNGVVEEAKIARVQESLVNLRTAIDIYEAKHDSVKFEDMFIEAKGPEDISITDSFYEDAYTRKKVPSFPTGIELNKTKGGIFVGGTSNPGEPFKKDVNNHSGAFIYLVKSRTGEQLGVYAYLHSSTYGGNIEWSKY